MPVASLRPLGVMILALLREGDMHPYEMIRTLEQRRDDRLVPLRRGTFYHQVSALERDGLISATSTERSGNRPERTLYTLEPRGRVVVHDWVRDRLPRLDCAIEFRVALAEADNLDRDEVVALLGQRRDALASYHGELVHGLAQVRERGVARQHLVEVERDLAVTSSDLTWTESLIDELASGSLPWHSRTSARQDPS